MSLATKLAVFTLLFNICSGILAVSLAPYLDQGLPKGMEYNENMSTINQEFKGSASAPGATGATGWWDKFQDFTRLSFFTKFVGILERTVWGITGIFNDIGIMPSEYNNYINSAITIIYALGIIEIYTGRKLGQ